MTEEIKWEKVHKDDCLECDAGLPHVVARAIPIIKNVVVVSDGTSELTVPPTRAGAWRLAQFCIRSAKRRFEHL